MQKTKVEKGFRAMDKERHREIASMGGIRAQQLGTAHRFTSKEAKLAGAKGGRKVYQLYGSEHMAKLGSVGGQGKGKKQHAK